MSQLNRRDFLATTSLSAVGLALGARPLHAVRLAPDVLRGPLHANAILPAPLAVANLESLATQAIDAAKSAGASYADIRIAEEYGLRIDIGMSGPETTMSSRFSYGVRVLVNGAWAFVHGTVPNADAVTAAARSAVATARGYASLVTHPVELIPAPVVTGSWTSPIKIDPFSIPLSDQIDLLYGIADVVYRELGGDHMGHFDWTKEVRSFASSEGSLVTQTLYRARPFTRAQVAQTMFPRGEVNLPNYGPVTAGYETVLQPDLQDQMRAAAERAARLSTLPMAEFDVGRFPIVFDGFTFAAALGQTLGQALQLDRALGAENDAAGSSFLAPPADIVGKDMINPLLNVTASRAVPSVHAVQWDDEGVVPDDFPLIKDGGVVDYCTSRDTAGALKSWYQQRGRPLRSHGCVVADNANEPVRVRTPHLYVTPATSTASVEDLCRDVSRGLLIMQGEYFSVDQQLTTGSLLWGLMYEIRKGKLVHRVRDAGIQFGTRKFWKSLTVLGGANSVRNQHYDAYKGNPWRRLKETGTAPAGLFKDVDVIGTGRRLGQ